MGTNSSPVADYPTPPFGTNKLMPACRPNSSKIMVASLMKAFGGGFVWNTFRLISYYDIYNQNDE